jgi:hypothetical protein
VINFGRWLGGGHFGIWAVVAVSLSALLLADLLARWYEPAARQWLDAHKTRGANTPTVSPFSQADGNTLRR